MKKACVWGLIFTLLIGLAPELVRAQGMGPSSAPPAPYQTSSDARDDEPGAPPPDSRCDSPPGEVVLLDALVVRPIGIGACAVGLVGALLTMPFAAMSHSTDRVQQSLIREPFEYTFTRPLGDLEYNSCNNRR